VSDAWAIYDLIESPLKDGLAIAIDDFKNDVEFAIWYIAAWNNRVRRANGELATDQEFTGAP
jgi:hypothetical protein